MTSGSSGDGPAELVPQDLGLAVGLLVQLLPADDTQVVRGHRRQRQPAVGLQRAQCRALVQLGARCEPLRVVLGLDVAGLQGVPSRGLEDARRAVDRMTALCDRLVDHGRESGPLEADPTAALADALALLPRSDRGRVVADFAALPPVALGPLELSQVLHNLLRNALQHAPHAWVEARSSDDGVALSVHDDGPGIPAARREALFTPYVTGRAHAGGTGLGLPLVRRLVEEAGGTVTVAQGPRGGACFSLALPLLRCRHARAA